uniref:Uncharacterized protein n=1 Tax=Amicula sp. isolate GU52X-4 cfCalB7 TaxID=3003489 RepID=A0A9E9C154_9STRA|nr:hypothetical protein [Amicula sp. isolate GU52X-4 cfCalB7]WAK84978.1 hypothetical protein [Amicula sp. isolate GU52X-4 cfCalB7]
MKVIEWPVENGKEVLVSKSEVLEQVVSGLNSINKSLGTNDKLSKIYFLPSDDGLYSVYELLICRLIKHYHYKNEDLVLTVDAETLQPLSLRNASDTQLDNLESTGNLGLDTRPPLILRLRGGPNPKNIF